MPVDHIPLIGTINARRPNARGNLLTSSKDQRFINCIFNVVKNQTTGVATVYAEKRPGLYNDGNSAVSGTPSTGAKAFLVPQGFTGWVAAQDDGTVTASASKVGTTTGSTFPMGLSETLISNLAFAVLTTTGSGANTSAAWYLASDAKTAGGFVVGNRTSGSPVISSISSTAGLYSGQLISGTGIPSNTRIQTVDSSSQITMNANASSGSSTSTTITVVDSLSKILDADYPINAVGRMVFLDGYAFVLTYDGKIFNSDLNTIISWAANNYIPTDSLPDAGVGLARYKNLIVAFGATSAEFFRNAGNATGSPLQRMEEYTLNTGAVVSGTGGASNAPYQPIVELDGTVYWLGVNQQGGRGIYRLNGFNAEKVSNASLDNVLSSADSIILGSVNLAGSQLLTLTIIGTSPRANFQFDTNIGEWSEMSLPSGDGFYGGGYNPPNISTYVLTGSASTAAVYEMGESNVVYQDAGSNFAVTIQTSRITHGTDRRKFIKSIRLIADEQASGTAALSYSDDDYATFTSLGTFDMTSHEKKISRCGSHKGGRAYKLTHSANTPFRAEALEIEYEVGTV